MQRFRLSFTMEAPEEAEGNLPLLSSSSSKGRGPAPVSSKLCQDPSCRFFQDIFLQQHPAAPESIVQFVMKNSMCTLPWARHCKPPMLHTAPSCIPTGQRHKWRGNRWRNNSEKQFSPSTMQREKTVTWRSSSFAESKLIPEMRVASGAANWYVHAEISWWRPGFPRCLSSHRCRQTCSPGSSEIFRHLSPVKLKELKWVSASN